MKIRTLAMPFRISLVVFTLLSAFAGRAFPQAGHTHAAPQSAAQQAQLETLVQIVRDSTERFKDFHAAEAAGYTLTFGCVTGPDAGAMGLHFVNFSLVGSGVIDAKNPQIVIYEPTPDGELKLIGADFLVIASQWDAAHPGTPPELNGQLFQYFESPNRFGLPAFYTLHVWAWKENPNGAFVNWHPNVSCKSFTGQTP